MELVTETVTIQRSGRADLDAYLARPKYVTRAPAVLVIHEIFGLDDHIRDVTRRFADEGYVALAVDLFSGGSRPLCLLRVMSGMLLSPLDNLGLSSLATALAHLKARPDVDPAKIGTVGFCMGGGYALALACTSSDVRAASVFYGMNPRPLARFARACPIVGSYPEHDFTRRGALELEKALEMAEVPHEIKIYQGERHGFFNDTRDAYSRAAAEDAWHRTLAFFAKHLITPATARSSP